MLLTNLSCRWMITDIHDAITSLAAHGKELPIGLTQEMRDEIDRLVRHHLPLAPAGTTCWPVSILDMPVSILGRTCSSVQMGTAIVDQQYSLKSHSPIIDQQYCLPQHRLLVRAVVHAFREKADILHHFIAHGVAAALLRATVDVLNCAIIALPGCICS